MRLSIRSYLGLPLVALVALAGGCGGTPHEQKFPGVTRVSQNGSTLYFQAKSQYGVVRALDLTGEPLKQEMDGVMSRLDGAIVNDPKCPLFFGKRGEMFVELGPDGAERAEYDLRTALKLSEDWVPAWIALADLEVRRGQTAKSRSYLGSAEKGIETLQTTVKKKPPPPFKVLGITIQSDVPETKMPDDPSLEETERRQLLLTWLQESEQWSIDSPGLLMPAKGGAGTTVNAENVFRRLRARVEYERIVIDLREGMKPAAVLPRFDKVFDWDPDYFPARIEKAAQLRRAGSPREAERILRPYLDSKDPKLSNNARLLYEMGAIYTDWYSREGGDKDAEKASKLAEECFGKLHKVNPRHASGWIKRAELYLLAGTRGHRRDTLRDARRWLANARELLKQETPEMQRISARLDEAEKTPATQGSHP